MSKNSRRSSCQRDSDGTDAAHPWRYRTVLAEQIALATSGAVHIRLLEEQLMRMFVHRLQQAATKAPTPFGCGPPQPGLTEPTTCHSRGDRLHNEDG